MPHPHLTVFHQETWSSNTQITEGYLDEQLAEVTGFWAAGKLDEITAYVKALVDQDIYDIRLLSFYFYSLWATDSDCSLHHILSALQQLLKQQPSIWFIESEDDTHDDADEETVTEALSESGKQQLQTSLNLFFGRIEQRLTRYSEEPYYQEKRPCDIIQCIEQLSETIANTYGLINIAPLIEQINLHFNDACEKEHEATEVSEAEAEEITTHSDSHSISDDKAHEETKPEEDREEAKTTQVVNNQQLPQTKAQTSATHYSPALQQLLNKLQIFETLMQEQDFYKSAIVFESIQNELQQFNPLHYLPELFSGYAKTHALFANELNHLLHEQNNAHAQALKDYFAIDPQGFLQLDIEPHEQAASRGEFQEEVAPRFGRIENDFDYDD